MGPNGPPNAKATAKIRPGNCNSRNPGLLGHVGDFGQPFPSQSAPPAKKNMREVAQINQTELCAGLAEFISTGSQTKFSADGAFVATG